MRIPILRNLIPFFLAAAGLSGCIFSTSEKVAQGGAQDFPNTVALGKAASQHISDNSEWDQFSVIPSSLPTFASAESLVVAPESLGQAKPKVAASQSAGGAGAAGSAKTGAGSGTKALSDTVFWDLSDTATLKVARRIHQQETVFKIKGDTLTYRWDDKANDNIIGNELLLESKGADLWKATERRQAYRYLNTDSAGGFDRAIFFERTPAILPAGFKVKVLVTTPGPDGDFGLAGNAAAAGDNRPAYYAYARTRTNAGGPADTVESFDITDVDGDGTLWGAGDSGVVDFRQQVPNPVLRPSVVMIVQKMRAVLFKQEQKTYPISFKETRDENDGKKVVFSVKGTRDGADSTFAAGDTVVVGVNVFYPADSRLVEKHTRYKVVLSGEPKKYSDNKLIKYTLEATWMKDSLVTTKLVFTPDNPVPSKELSITGDLELSASFANGHAGEAAGRFENKLIDVILTDKAPDGILHRFHVKWDAAGNVVKQEHSD
ncbi:MAG: hypothetical protein JWO30_140 [Fibrobacteres bacterium]|nr:hypothetical protein [Fibrobacterota bacterium]